jgi:hypothetical protein
MGNNNDFLIQIHIIIQQSMPPHNFIDENIEIKLHENIYTRCAFIYIGYIHRKMSYISSSSSKNVTILHAEENLRKDVH